MISSKFNSVIGIALKPEMLFNFVRHGVLEWWNNGLMGYKKDISHFNFFC